jgi:dihydrofolate reductase
MGQLIVHQFVTLDGVLQAPGGPDEDRESGFAHGGWQAPYLDDESSAAMAERWEGPDAMLFGRKTYEIFASYWPTASDDISFTRIVNEVPKYVASRTLTSVEWAGTTLIEGDVAEEVPRLKERHDSIHVWGSGDLIQTLLRHRLVDRLNLWLYPVVLGTGKRLFPEGTISTAMRLAESATFSSGAVLLVYEPDGEPVYGDLTV